MKTFPMFLKMSGRRVLIIGGGEQAAQKARLVLKTEANVCVLADTLDLELAGLAADGRITHLNEPLTTTLLQSAILVFSATGCAGAGAAHAALARAANTVINVVDMPEYCEAMTPSIVDRDPLVVAIGTEGNAPILGRQIKSRIETLLEPRLGTLVAFAGRMRPAVARTVPQSKRRGFWKRVFDGPVRREFAAGNERRALGMLKAQIAAPGAAPDAPGCLSTVVAPAPEPDLVTLRTLRQLQEADVIFYEAGLHDGILELARRDAERTAYRCDARSLPALARLIGNPLSEGKNVVVLSRRDLNLSAARDVGEPSAVQV